MNFTATPYSVPVPPVAIDAPRRAGKFAPKADPRAITPVILCGGRRGWMVGPGGRIYADKAEAKGFAARRGVQSVKGGA